MSLLVDTSVWSLALRRDAPASPPPEVEKLQSALTSGEAVFTTGLVLQELLQGFRGPRQHAAIVARFASLPLVVPDRRDHIEAAGLRNECRRRGVQLGTIDALIAQISVRHQLVLLTTDADFTNAAQHVDLTIWRGR